MTQWVDDSASASQALDSLKRLPQLDGLRAVAFLAVFIHHAVGLPLGWVGVDLFFVLSGFLITGILIREKGAPRYFRTFYLRRFLRIFPPYYLFLGLTVLVLGMGFLPQAWWYLLFLSNVRDSLMTPFVSWLSPMWSLAVEEQYYLLWPLVVAAVPRRRLIGVCLCLVALAPVVRGLLTLNCTNFRPIYHLLPARMDLLAAGGLLALLRVSEPEWFRRLTKCAPVMAALAAGFFGILVVSVKTFRTSANSLLFNTLGYSLILVLMTGVLATTIGLKVGLGFRFLSNRSTVFVGTISYTLYLVHKLALTAAHSVITDRFLAVGLGLALSVAWASLSWYLMEKPLVDFKNGVAPYLKPIISGRKGSGEHVE